MVLLALCAPIAGLATRAFAQDVCVDLNKLPMSQKGLRRSFGFKPQAPDPKKQCGGCSFFKGSTAGCGTCQLLSGGAVFATSTCDNWAAKA